MDKEKIKQSKYKVKSNVQNNFLWVCIVSLIIFIILYPLNLLGSANNIFFLKDKLDSVCFFISKIVFLIITFIVPLVYIIYKLSKQNLSFKKLGFSNIGVEIEKNEGTIFDVDMDEIIYIIANSGAHTLVFEDLDRFENTDLFVKLREINHMVNITSKNPIKFIYMIRDDVFISKDRTKFFDYIMPVIPIMGGYNCGSLFEKLFNQDDNHEFRPSKEIIERISIYIDEYRLLKNIYNEYSIYKEKISLEKRGLKADNCWE